MTQRTITRHIYDPIASDPCETDESHDIIILNLCTSTEEWERRRRGTDAMGFNFYPVSESKSEGPDQIGQKDSQTDGQATGNLNSFVDFRSSFGDSRWTKLPGRSCILWTECKHILTVQTVAGVGEKKTTIYYHIKLKYCNFSI